MRNLGIWFVILLLPIAAVLGQDGYMAYNNPHGFDFSKPFPFSDAGWIWQRHAFASWDWAHHTIDPQFWRRFVKPVLDQKAIIVAAAPLVMFCALLLFFKLLGLGPFAGSGFLIRRTPGLSRNRYLSENRSGAKPKMRYKRR